MHHAVLDQERHEGLSKGSSTEAVIAIDATDFLRKRINRKHPARGTDRRHSAVDHFNHGVSADDAVPVDFTDDSDTADHPPQLININAFRRSIPVPCWRWLGFVGKGAQAGDKCGTYTLSNTGVRGADGKKSYDAGYNPDCWGK